MGVPSQAEALMTLDVNDACVASQVVRSLEGAVTSANDGDLLVGIILLVDGVVAVLGGQFDAWNIRHLLLHGAGGHDEDLGPVHAATGEQHKFTIGAAADLFNAVTLMLNLLQ